MYHVTRTVVALTALLLSATIDAAAQHSFSLSDAYRIARERNPRLQAATALVKAKAALQPGAALPPDPQLQIGAMNFSIPGFAGDMATSMIPSIQLMQMLPWFGKLGVSA